MDQGLVMETFRVEAEQFSQAIEGLSDDDWGRPTACEPWRVRDLVGHVRVVIGWLPGMLSAPSPAEADISAAEYYRPGQRFAPEMNAARIALAQDHAAGQASGDALAKDFADLCRHVIELCQAEPDQRTVQTRHGDAMLLSEFLLTRIVEVAIHGLDLAAALGRRPWLTVQAGNAVEELLLGDQGTARIRRLGWDRRAFLRKATGREPISESEALQINGMGIRWLTLG
jgi:uncharacterized protein (TIGR03083 family)